MEKIEQEYKQGTRVFTPDGPGTVFEFCLGFYSVEVDGYRKDKYYKSEQLTLLEDQTIPDSE